MVAGGVGSVRCLPGTTAPTVSAIGIRSVGRRSCQNIGLDIGQAGWGRAKTHQFGESITILISQMSY